MITFDDFKKLEIKIGKVKSVERVPDTDKLLKFIFDVGSEERQIMAGMAEFFIDPSSLIGKEMPILMNIEPRSFRGYQSHGMIIAADVGGHPILLHPEREIPAGSIIR
ncbi:MAG: methionine--tRNA ligase [Candidatus Peregrinibacteria bacterium]